MRSRYHRSNNGGGARHQNGQVSFNRNHVFDSNGPDGRIRGNAQQLCEKYNQHGRDALSSGDRVAAESFFQYVEHYSRLLNTINQAVQQRHRPIQPSGGQDNVVEEVKIDLLDNIEEEKQIEDIIADPSEESQPIIIDIQPEKIPMPKSRPGRRGRPPRIIVEKKLPQEDEQN